MWRKRLWRSLSSIGGKTIGARSNELVDLFQSILPRKYVDKERIRSKIRNLKKNYENLRKKKDKLNATELNRYEVMSIIWPSANHGE